MATKCRVGSVLLLALDGVGRGAAVPPPHPQRAEGRSGRRPPRQRGGLPALPGSARLSATSCYLLFSEAVRGRCVQGVLQGVQAGDRRGPPRDGNEKWRGNVAGGQGRAPRPRHAVPGGKPDSAARHGMINPARRAESNDNNGGSKMRPLLLVECSFPVPRRRAARRGRRQAAHLESNKQE